MKALNSKIILWARIFVSSVSCTAFSSAAFATETQTYGALLGNHDYLTVKVNDSSVSTESSYMNGSESSYYLDFSTRKITAKNSNGENQVLTWEEPEYLKHLLKLRDIVAFVASPTSLETSYPLKKIVRPELNALIEKISSLSELELGELANCILYPESQSDSPQLYIGGVHSSLGELEDNVSRVWVRYGYELVLISGRSFADSDATVITARGDGMSTGPGLPILESMPTRALDRSADGSLGYLGAHFTLSQTELYHKIGSAVCRPDFATFP